MAAMFAHDAHRVVETEPQALSRGLSGEEWLEDAVLQLRRDAPAVVPYLHQTQLALHAADNAQAAGLIGSRHGLQGVLNQRCPNLIQFAAISADARKIRLITPLHRHPRH